MNPSGRYKPYLLVTSGFGRGRRMAGKAGKEVQSSSLSYQYFFNRNEVTMMIPKAYPMEVNRFSTR